MKNAILKNHNVRQVFGYTMTNDTFTKLLGEAMGYEISVHHEEGCIIVFKGIHDFNEHEEVSRDCDGYIDDDVWMVKLSNYIHHAIKNVISDGYPHNVIILY